MTALHDLDAGVGHELGRAPVARQRPFGQGAQHIERGQRLGELRQRRHVGLQGVEQLFVEPLLARQRPILRTQCLVFEGLELPRDEALGVL